MLAGELKRLISRLDEEGLCFLIKQAQVIIHNLEAERINRALLAKSQSPAQGREQQVRTETSRELEVFVEKARNGEHYIVVLGTKRKMFSYAEFQKLVGIAHAARDEQASGEQIYNWLKQNRGDVLFDVNLANKKHPLLIRLACFLRSHFPIKK